MPTCRDPASNLRSCHPVDCRLAGLTIDGVPVEDLIEAYRQVRGGKS